MKSVRTWIAYALCGALLGAATWPAVERLVDPWYDLEQRDLILVSETCPVCRDLLDDIDQDPERWERFTVLSVDPQGARTTELCRRALGQLRRGTPAATWLPERVSCRLLTTSARRYHRAHFSWVPAIRIGTVPLGFAEQQRFLARIRAGREHPRWMGDPEGRAGAGDPEGRAGARVESHGR